MNKRLACVIYVYKQRASVSISHFSHFILDGKLGWLRRDSTLEPKLKLKYQETRFE